MRLSELLKCLDIHFEGNPLKGKPDPEILGVGEHSSEVLPGHLFFARQGTKVSGTQYLAEALKRGAAAILTDQDLQTLSIPSNIPAMKVPSISDAESKIANYFYGFPSKNLTVSGVTGTNGKTTFTYLMESIAKKAGIRTGIIGTINYRIPKTDSDESEFFPSTNTTPNALRLQKILHEMVQRKTQVAVLEVSSHALALGRVDGIEFDGAVFTNLTQDHLDFHRTMDDYFLAKSKLFTELFTDLKAPISGHPSKKFCAPFAAINIDDPYGKILVKKCAVNVLEYSAENPAKIYAKDIQLSSSGTVFNLVIDDQTMPIKSSLVGQHNVYNILSAAAAATAMRISNRAIIDGIEAVRAIPGRLELVTSSKKKQPKFSVFVDYAHTEDALKNVLNALKVFARGRIITVFGCGGDRDRSKRPLMGKSAAHLSDWVILTSDNPRSEDPEKIILDIEIGIRNSDKKNYEIIEDREKAVRQAIAMAEENDIVLLAGKGHETYQIYKDKTIHFDDREIAAEALRKLT